MEMDRAGETILTTDPNFIEDMIQRHYHGPKAEWHDFEAYKRELQANYPSPRQFEEAIKLFLERGKV